MPTRPCTDLRQLRSTAENRHCAVAMSLMADAARSLSRRLGLKDDRTARQTMEHLLRQLGITDVYFDNSLQDAQTLLEAKELLMRLYQGGPLPLMLCSCPRWMEELCANDPAQKQYFRLSQTHIRCRGLALRSLLTAQRRIPFSCIAHVTVVDCASQKSFYGSCLSSPSSCIGEEYVITVRELCLWLCARGILSAAQAEAGELSAPTRSRLSQVCRQAYQLECGATLPEDELSLTPAAGNPCISEGTLELQGRTLRYARVRGQRDAAKLLMLAGQGIAPYDLMEVFLCGGCC